MTEEIFSAGGERILKISCSGCSSGGVVESSHECMRHVVNLLIENPDADVVILSDAYDKEYRGEVLGHLKEFARVLKNEELWGCMHLTIEGCTRCLLPRKSRLEKILEEARGNPKLGMKKLKEFYYESKLKEKRGSAKCRECRRKFLESLASLLSSLESLSLFRQEASLHPLVRPCFLTSRILQEPPRNCRLIDSYEVDGARVEIYEKRDELQKYFFIWPPEYSLPFSQIELLQETRRKLLESPPAIDQDIGRARELVERLSEEILVKIAAEKKVDVSREEVKWLAKYLARFTAGLGILDILLADEKVQDVYIDSPAGEIPIYLNHRDHGECTTNVFLSPADIDSLVSKFRAMSGRPFSEADPVLDVDLRGVRVALVGQPLSPGGVAMALRRHKPTPWTLPQFIDVGFMTPQVAGFLSLLVDVQSSVLITGSRGSGKTSLLSALMLELLPKYRVLTVEDTMELPVDQLRRLGFKIQPFRVQSAVSSTDVEMSAEEALRATLRLGDSVLVIGEVRGEEAKTLYEAMRVGTAGNSVLGTIHGATARDVFERVVYDLGIHPSSFKATDVIAVAAPVRMRGGVERTRKLFQVTEVKKGWKKDPVSERGFVDLFSFDYSRMEAVPTAALENSEVIWRIAKKWASTCEEVMKNFEFRSRIAKALVEIARESGQKRLLEADFVVKSNLFWRGLLEEELRKRNVSYRRIFHGWFKWLEEAAGKS